jgi:FtsP/CotA-like multicopper oxidase with cupredoxin domain
MRYSITTRVVSKLAILGMVAGMAVVLAGPAQAQITVEVDLCATSGTHDLFDTNSAAVWGFALGDCTGTPVPSIPGPALDVDAGDTLSVTVYNDALTMTENVNFAVAGFAAQPDPIGVAPGASKTYTFTGFGEGTYAYQSDLHAVHPLMGLSGAVVVDPAGAGTPTIQGEPYDEEALIVLSEIDTAFNALVEANGSNSPLVNLTDYKANYFLINGRSHGGELNNPVTQMPDIEVEPGDTVLLRYVNASSLNNTMTALNLRQQVVTHEQDAGAFSQRDASEVHVSAGQTSDVLVTVGDVIGERYPVYNRNLRSTSTEAGPAGPGSQLVFISVIPRPNISYMSIAGNKTAAFLGTALQSEDIFSWNENDPGSPAVMVLDGSDLGIDTYNIDALWVDTVNLVNGNPVFFVSFSGNFATPADPAWTTFAPTAVDESDIVRFEATTLGTTTSGSFFLEAEGATMGLDGADEDIAALFKNPATDNWVVSLRLDLSGVNSDGESVPSLGGFLYPQNEDLLEWDPATSTWSVYFDGTGTLLNGGETPPNNLDSVEAAGMRGTDLALSVRRNQPAQGPADFGGLSAWGNDVFTCNAPSFIAAPIPTQQCDGLSMWIQLSARPGGNPTQGTIDAWSSAG